MRRELENIEYIERYLDNELSKTDKYKFEQYMQQDAGFKATVELQRALVSQIKEEAFLMDVTAYHQEFVQQQQPRFRFRPIWLLLPFLLMISLSIGWYCYPSSTVENDPLTLAEPSKTTNPSSSTIQTAAVEAKAFKKAFISKKISARKGAVIQLKASASTLYIPKNAVVDQEGNPVKGAYDLQYRELRDRSQMAFSNLPMQYKNKKNAHGVNSVGIVEVRAFKNGKELKIAENKALTLDYEVNKRMSNLELYHLDEDANAWESTATEVQLPKRDAYTESFDSVTYQTDVAAYQKKFNQPKSSQPKLAGSTWNASTSLMPENMKKLAEEEKPDPSKYIVKHYKNPKLVNDLQLNSFGVYNCGQIYQVKNQIAVAAHYTDLQQAVIDNAQILSIIDMNYNAAYSFKPEQFICNATANNVFLLWSNDGKLYSFVKRSTIKMSTGEYSFQMEDLSPKVKNTKDLKRYLKFVAKKTKENVTKIQ